MAQIRRGLAGKVVPVARAEIFALPPIPQTPNAEPRTPNAERRTPNAKRRTPNAKRQTPNAKP
jgi:hypothetical protein